MVRYVFVIRYRYRGQRGRAESFTRAEKGNPEADRTRRQSGVESVTFQIPHSFEEESGCAAMQ